MIRMIASDIDGTLLHRGQQAIDPVIFEEIRRLRAAGILFCLASGRQYNSMRRLFTPVADELVFLCENGAVAFGPGSSVPGPGEPGPVLSKLPMDRSGAEALSRDILSIDGCEVLISGANMSYVIPKEVDMVELMHRDYGNLTTRLDRPEDVPEEIIKVSVCCLAGTGAVPPWLAEKWQRFHPAVAGDVWVDFNLADKGSGLTRLCGALDIPMDEVMAFGDNFNDIPMLEAAGRSYIMENADPQLLDRFPGHCRRVEDILRLLP